jgi:hypothetical protein
VHVSFLTPLAGLVALAVVPALVAAVRADGRARAVRERLALFAPFGRSLASTLAAIGAIAVLIGLAAMQPVVERSRPHRVRTDADALVVVDTSRSMQASASPGLPTRLERAQTFAHTLRARLNDVPMGVASVTDRVLPYIFPTANAEAVDRTIDESVAIQNPPPIREIATRATQFGALARIPTTNFFSPAASKHIVVVISDGESLPFSRQVLGTALRRSNQLFPIFVHVWRPDERVFTGGVAEPAYQPDPSSGATMAELGAATNGLSVDEKQLGRVVSASKAFLGNGTTARSGSERASLGLAPFSLLAALVPLAVLFRRRVF